MPQRSDYILRLIETAGRMLAALRERMLGRQSSPGELEASLRSVGGMVGVDLEIARAATPDMLEMIVSPAGELDATRCFVAAEMLYLDGLEAQQRGDQDAARNAWDRALRLYRLVEPRGSFLVGWPEAGARVAEIQEQLRTLSGNGTDKNA